MGESYPLDYIHTNLLLKPLQCTQSMQVCVYSPNNFALMKKNVNYTPLFFLGASVKDCEYFHKDNDSHQIKVFCD